MKLGVNNTINSDTKSVGIKSMDGGKSKTKKFLKAEVKTEASKVNCQDNCHDNITSSKTSADTNTNHEVTKVGVLLLQ